MERRCEGEIKIKYRETSEVNMEHSSKIVEREEIDQCPGGMQSHWIGLVYLIKTGYRKTVERENRDAFLDIKFLVIYLTVLKFTKPIQI